MSCLSQRSERTGVTLEEIADRLAIREFIDAYAHCARTDSSETVMEVMQ